MGKIKLFNRECRFVKMLQDFEPFKTNYAIEITKNGQNIDYTIKSLIQPSKPPKRKQPEEEKKEAL